MDVIRDLFIIFVFIILIVISTGLFVSYLNYCSINESVSIKVTFNEFMTTYRLHKDRYTLDKDMILVEFDDGSKGCLGLKGFMDYANYRVWLEKHNDEELVEKFNKLMIDDSDNEENLND